MNRFSVEHYVALNERFDNHENSPLETCNIHNSSLEKGGKLVNKLIQFIPQNVPSFRFHDIKSKTIVSARGKSRVEAHSPKRSKRRIVAIFQRFEGGDDYEEESSSSAGYHTDESCSLTPEPALVFLDGSGGNFSVAQSGGDVSAERLAEMYSALYDHAHLHTLDALDALRPLNDAPDLKAKILYSVVVVSNGKFARAR